MKYQSINIVPGFILILSLIFVLGCKKTDECDTSGLPKIEANQHEISLVANETAEIVLTVVPSVSTNWKISGLPEWLNVEPLEGTITDEQKIIVAGNPEKMGDKIVVSGRIEIISENASLTYCYVSYRKNNLSHIWPVHENNIISYNENEKQIAIKNKSSDTLQWNIVAQQDYLEIEPNSGILTTLETTEFTVYVDRSLFISGDYNSILQLTDSKGGMQEIEITVRHYIEQKWLFGKELYNTTYDMANNRIIAISRNPNELHILYPEDEIIESISLDYVPSAISVNPSGTKAAIGSADGYLTVVDLTTSTLKNQFVYDDLIYSLVFGYNNKLYFNFDYSPNDSIYIYNVNTEEIKSYREPWMAGGVKFSLHPSGDYIYAFDGSTGLKYEITSDSATVVFRRNIGSSQGYNIIFNDNGSKMYVGEDVFRSSENPALDINYITSCTSVYNSKFMDYSSLNESLITWGGEPYWNKKLFLVDESMLFITNIFALPLFYNPEGIGSTGKAECHMAYFNNDATKIFALLKPESSYFYTGDWAIMIYENY